MSARINRTMGAKSLNKYEKLSSILKYIFVDVCKIDQDKYFILGSFAIREHRLINDLDINIDTSEFMKLERAVERGFGGIEFYNGQIRWYFDLTDEYNTLNGAAENDFSIEAFMKDSTDGFPNSKFSLGHLIKTHSLDVDRNGHPFFNLETLLKWKKTMNRPKDSADIELIKALLKS
jgi:hypothetical protein